MHKFISRNSHIVYPNFYFQLVHKLILIYGEINFIFFFIFFSFNPKKSVQLLHSMKSPLNINKIIIYKVQSAYR